MFLNVRMHCVHLWLPSPPSLATMVKHVQPWTSTGQRGSPSFVEETSKGSHRNCLWDSITISKRKSILEDQQWSQKLVWKKVALWEQGKWKGDLLIVWLCYICADQGKILAPLFYDFHVKIQGTYYILLSILPQTTLEGLHILFISFSLIYLTYVLYFVPTYS